MSLRVSVTLTLNQAEYLLDLLDDDLDDGPKDPEMAEAATRKIERSVNIVTAMRQKKGPKT